MEVTAENAREYVELYLLWVLEDSIKPHFEAFRKGFLKVCGGDALNLFHPQELEVLLCGAPHLDFHALEAAAQYEEPLNATSQLIKNFWKILHSFDETEKKLFLKFISGSDRAPIRGLGSMTFVISKHGDDSDRLPSAHTCFNHLLLPLYSSKEKLEAKLKAAMLNSEGFGVRTCVQPFLWALVTICHVKRLSGLPWRIIRAWSSHAVGERWCQVGAWW
ncbi:hect e3 ubiquitin [Nannochloropsis gaditana]|uniref:HECT-type E3 ubiquitin transferase n=2 Tax=Nannochloropsis gaditana TaxID=72520 RepID=W7TQV1_9STRA|nr:hect e3 ubiquitin [Nannochloropsis gaditana]